jgi:hypothetical protein
LFGAFSRGHAPCSRIQDIASAAIAPASHSHSPFRGFTRQPGLPFLIPISHSGHFLSSLAP